jgi:hypothetical protein
LISVENGAENSGRPSIWSAGKQGWHTYRLTCYLCFFFGIIVGILNRSGVLFLALVGGTGRLAPCLLFSRR